MEKIEKMDLRVVERGGDYVVTPRIGYVDYIIVCSGASGSHVEYTGASRTAKVIGAIPEMVKALKECRSRFSDLNGKVSKDVWDGNYDAVKSIDDALEKAGV